MRLLSLALVFTLACSDDAEDTVGPGDGGGTSDGGTADGGTPSDGGGSEPDSDGDGWPDSEDCDPYDARINPDAEEVCDHKDNDCDGETDGPNATDTSMWYIDADDDGYGDEADAGTVACYGATGTVDNNLDCADEDPTRNPDITETCNELDDDCDGDVDEAGSVGESTFYRDSDGDGYGDVDMPADSCSTPSGFSVDATDCDDTEATVNPGMEELCNDGLDNDCDGTGEGCVLEGSATSSDAHDSEGGESTGDKMGASMTSAGDTNGDGIDDLLVGAPYAEEGGTSNAGSTYLYLGSVSGVDTTASATMSGAGENVQFGSFVGTMGDANEDGYDDVIVSTAAGLSAYLFYGPMSGNTEATDADVIFADSATSTTFGYRAISAGDVDGDGNIDALITAPGYRSHTGAAYLFLGPLTGSYEPSDAIARLAGESLAEWVGTAASAPGDLDGDGVDDFALSAEKYDGDYSDSGQVFLWFGALTGNAYVSDADLAISGAEVNDNFGKDQWGAGDTNGDGYADLVVGTPRATSSTGGAWLFLGPLKGGTLSATSADAIFEGSRPGEVFGTVVRGEGDTDGDGNDDLAFTATTTTAGAGAAYLFYGPVTGTYDSGDADFTVEGASSTIVLGTSVAINGDYDDDGREDFAIGGTGASSNTGAWYLFYAGDL